MSQSAPKVAFPLRLKLLVFGSFLAVIPTVAVGFGLMEINAVTLESQNRELRLAVAEDISTTLEATLKQGQLGLLRVQQVVTNRALSDDTRIELATAMVEADPLLDTVAIYGRQGDYVAQIDQSNNRFTEDPLAEDIAKDAAATGLVLTPVGDTTVEIVMPIRPTANQVTGFTRTRVDLKDAQQHTVAIAKARLSAGSRIDVVTTEGKVMLSTDAAAIGSILPPEGMMKDLKTVVNQGVAHSGEHPTKPLLVSARPLKSLPWVTHVQVPLDEAYASLNTMRRWVVAVTILAAFLALLLAFVFAGRLTRPLDRLMEMTRRLADRAFDARVDIQTNDEIGMVASSLNRAAEDLEESEAQIATEIAIRTDLGRYLSKDLVDNVVKREQAMDLGGERRNVTVLFADVVRFTPLCEHHPPEVVVTILNELFTLMTTIVFESGGTVDKFIGDCVMAFWGAPKDDPDHAIHALEAAEKMVRLLEFGNTRWMKEYGIEIQLAIGINTGEAVIGNIGSDTRMEYTAIGKTVNLAARLEALANPSQVLVSQGTVAAASDVFEFRTVSTELLSVGSDHNQVFEVVL